MSNTQEFTKPSPEKDLRNFSWTNRLKGALAEGRAKVEREVDFYRPEIDLATLGGAQIIGGHAIDKAFSPYKTYHDHVNPVVRLSSWAAEQIYDDFAGQTFGNLVRHPAAMPSPAARIIPKMASVAFGSRYELSPLADWVNPMTVQGFINVGQAGIDAMAKTHARINRDPNFKSKPAYFPIGYAPSMPQ